MTGTVAFITIQAVNKASKELKAVEGSLLKLGVAQKNQAKAQAIANRGSKEAASANDKLKDTMRKLASSIAVIDGPLGGVASRFNAFGTTIGRVNKRLIGVTAAFIAVAAASRIGLRSFGEIEKLTFRLETTLANTGRTGEIAINTLTEAAKDLAIQTLASEQGALEAISTIASFEDIPTSKLVEILNLSQDLSVILGGDLKNNALILARSFNDVEAAGEFLRRKGLKLEEQEIKLIETLVAEGKQLQAITFLQEKLSNIQGVAAGEARGLAGVIDTLGVQMGITFREFAKATGIAELTKNTLLALTGVLKSLETAFKALGDTIGFVKDTWLLWTPLIIAMGASHIPRLIKQVKLLSETFQLLVAVELTSFLPKITTRLINMGVVTIGLRASFIALGKAALSLIAKLGLLFVANPFGALIVGITAVVTLLATLHKDFDGFKDVWKAFQVGGLLAVENIEKGLRSLRFRAAETMSALKVAAAFAPFGKTMEEVAIEEVKKLAALRDKLNKDELKSIAEFEAKLLKIAGIEEIILNTKGKQKDVVKKLSKEQKKILEQLEKQKKSIEEQIATNELILSGQESSLAVAKLLVQAENAKFKEARDVLIASAELTRQLEAQNIILEERQNLRSGLEDLESELAALNLVISGQEKSLELAKLELQIRAATDPVARGVLERTKEATVALERQQEVLARQKQEWDSVDSAVKDTFKDIITGTDSILGALDKLVDKLTDVAIEAVLADIKLGSLGGGGQTGSPFDIFNLFGSLLGSAKGNVFQGQSVIPFAKGGLIDRPSVFPLKTGIGMAGEAGTEAIMPLQRLPNGELGVRNAGGSSGEQNININMNINGVQDADSFKRSQNQIASSLATSIDRASRRNN